MTDVPFFKPSTIMGPVDMIPALCLNSDKHIITNNNNNKIIYRIQKHVFIFPRELIATI